MNKGTYGLGKVTPAANAIIGAQGQLKKASGGSGINLGAAGANGTPLVQVLDTQSVDVAVVQAGVGGAIGLGVRFYYGTDVAGALTKCGGAVYSPDDAGRLHMWPFLVPAGNKLFAEGNNGVTGASGWVPSIVVEYVESPSKALRRACRRSSVSNLGTNSMVVTAGQTESPWVQWARETDFLPGVTTTWRIPDLGAWEQADSLDIGVGAAGSQTLMATLTIASGKIRALGGVPYSSLFPALTTEVKSGLLVQPADWWMRIRLPNTFGGLFSTHCPLLVAAT